MELCLLKSPGLSTANAHIGLARLCTLNCPERASANAKAEFDAINLTEIFYHLLMNNTNTTQSKLHNQSQQKHYICQWHDILSFWGRSWFSPCIIFGGLSLLGHLRR